MRILHFLMLVFAVTAYAQDDASAPAPADVPAATAPSMPVAAPVTPPASAPPPASDMTDDQTPSLPLTAVQQLNQIPPISDQIIDPISDIANKLATQDDKNPNSGVFSSVDSSPMITRTQAGVLGENNDVWSHNQFADHKHYIIEVFGNNNVINLPILQVPSEESAAGASR